MGLAGQPVDPYGEDVTAAVLPERFQVDAIRIERHGAAERLAIRHVVDIEEPASRRHVFVVARTASASAHACRLEAAYP